MHIESTTVVLCDMHAVLMSVPYLFERWLIASDYTVRENMSAESTAAKRYCTDFEWNVKVYVMLFHWKRID